MKTLFATLALLVTAWTGEPDTGGYTSYSEALGAVQAFEDPQADTLWLFVEAHERVGSAWIKGGVVGWKQALVQVKKGRAPVVLQLGSQGPSIKPSLCCIVRRDGAWYVISAEGLDHRRTAFKVAGEAVVRLPEAESETFLSQLTDGKTLRWREFKVHCEALNRENDFPAQKVTRLFSGANEVVCDGTTHTVELRPGEAKGVHSLGVSDGKNFTAICDLDCDGHAISYAEYRNLVGRPFNRGYKK